MSDLFERKTLGLHEHKPDADDLDDQDDDVHKVEFPPDALQADRVDVLIENLNDHQRYFDVGLSGTQKLTDAQDTNAMLSANPFARMLNGRISTQ